MLPGWHERLFKVTVGLGSGPTAATVETTVDGPEYIGPFIGAEASRERQAWQRQVILDTVATRFPDEVIKIVEITPTAVRVRPRWDRR